MLLRRCARPVEAPRPHCLPTGHKGSTRKLREGTPRRTRTARGYGKVEVVSAKQGKGVDGDSVRDESTGLVLSNKAQTSLQAAKPHGAGELVKKPHKDADAAHVTFTAHTKSTHSTMDLLKDSWTKLVGLECKPHLLPAPPAPTGIEVYVALPWDVIRRIRKDSGMSRIHRRSLQASLQALKLSGVTGVSMEMWWGHVENKGPTVYDWSIYSELVELVAAADLKVRAVMAFHACAKAFAALPQWVLAVANNNPDVLFTDRGGMRNFECLSLGVDTIGVLDGRSPLQCYSDFMTSFRNHFKTHLGTTITEVSVGMGPSGELRYPSYPGECDGRWRFPGTGEFQCYDMYMLQSLKAHAEEKGKPEWGWGGPHDAGHYNQGRASSSPVQWGVAIMVAVPTGVDMSTIMFPHEAKFFHGPDGGWTRSYGDFFLEWYSQQLIDHGRRLGAAASSIFKHNPVKLQAKLAGVHWWHHTESHAAELTAGYYTTCKVNGYVDLMRMFAETGLGLTVPCAEMRDREQPKCALASPEKLVEQMVMAALELQVPLSLENSVERFDRSAYNQSLHAAHFLAVATHARAGAPTPSFVFQRMGEALFQPHHWVVFHNFVQSLVALNAEVFCLEGEHPKDEHPMSCEDFGFPETPLAYHHQQQNLLPPTQSDEDEERASSNNGNVPAQPVV